MRHGVSSSLLNQNIITMKKKLCEVENLMLQVSKKYLFIKKKLKPEYV